MQINEIKSFVTLWKWFHSPSKVAS